MSTVIVVDITAATFSAEGSWDRPASVTVTDGDGTVIVRTPGRALAGASGREALLVCADQACTVGMLTADPAQRGRRAALPVVWFVPATGSAKVGASSGDGPVVCFRDGLALPARGWAFGDWDSAAGTLTVAGSPPAEVAEPVDQTRLGAVLTALAA